MQSLIRTAEQLKIKGLCEINEHTATNTESDTEVIYPPHKKIRASRHYDSGHRNYNQSQQQQQEKEKDAHPIATQESESKRKSKSPVKEIGKSLSPTTAAIVSSSQNQSKNMASLEMGMVSINLKFHKCLIASFVDVVVVVSLLLIPPRLIFNFFPLFFPSLHECVFFSIHTYLHAERKCCDSASVHGFCTRTTGTHRYARHYNRSKLHTEPRYKRSVK